MVIAAIVEVDAGGGDARSRQRRLFGLAVGVGDLLDAELAIRDWARRDAHVAERVRRVDNRRMTYLRELFSELHDDPVDIEMRCFVVLAIYVGTHHIAADHGRRTRSAVMKDVVRWVLG